MSAKALGQIHTVNYRQSITGSSFPDDVILVDLPGQLTQQLQTLVRCGTYHKVVGIDMTLDTIGTIGGGQLSGRIRYYAPTKGRCAAFRGAFKAMKEQMKNQGVNTMVNELYDFRAPINNNTHQSGDFPNQATLDGSRGLALYDASNPGRSIFDVHNRNVHPSTIQQAGDIFQPGFDTLLQDSATGTDFVLNDTVPYTGNRNTASVEYEEIPFTLSWTPDSTDLAIDWQWRPDPALFLAVLSGQMSVIVEEMNVDGTPSPSGLNLNVAVMVSGWKSIMGDPSKRSKRKSKSTKKGSK